MDPDQNALLARRAVKAAQARRRRHAKGMIPRAHSKARVKPWLYEGLTRTAWYEAGRHRPDDCVATSADGCVADHPDGFVASVPSDEFVATSLARRVRLLPGGRDPMFLAFLERLVAEAPAARAAWGDCDPALAALLNAED